MKPSKIYAIESEGKVMYVGVTQQRLSLRINSHVSNARCNRRERGAPKLCEWLRSDPIFSVRVLEEVPKSQRYERERYWIKFYDCINSGLNSEHTSGSGRPKGCKNPSGKDHYMFGKKACQAAVAASVAARTGKKLSKEHREKIRLGNLGKKKKRSK